MSLRKRRLEDDQSDDPRISFEDAIQVLQDETWDTVTRVRQRQYLNIIQASAHTDGLMGNDISTLMTLINSKNFSSSVSNNLVKSLVPRTSVPVKATITAVFILHGKNASERLKVAIVKWLVSIWEHGFLENKNMFHNLYDLIFMLLRYERLCPYICYLLYELTRKDDIAQFRVETLKDLIEQRGKQPHLLALWNYYCGFIPEVLEPIDGEAHFTRVSTWDDAFAATLDRLGQPIVAKKKNRLSVSSNALESVNTVIDLEMVMKLAHSRLSIPEIISSSFRRQILGSGDPILKHRFKYWFFFAVRDMLQFKKPRKSEENPLKILFKLCMELPCFFNETADFLARHLEHWDGEEEVLAVIYLLQHIKICLWDDLEPILRNLHDFFLTMTVDFQVIVIQELSELFCNWLLFAPSHDLQADIVETDLISLGNYIDKLCCLSLQLNPQSETIVLNLALAFYSRHLQLLENSPITILLIPSAQIVYSSLFSFSSCTLHSLCQLLLLYCRTIDLLKRKDKQPSELEDSIAVINSCIIDIMNTLFYEKGFQYAVNSSLYKSDFAEVARSVLNSESVFILHNHPALLSNTLTFCKQSSVSWPKHFNNKKRLQSYVDYLKSERQLGAISDFRTKFSSKRK